MLKERFIPLFARRLTHKKYINSKMSNVPFPGFVETITLYVCSVLPPVYFKYHGMQSLIKLSVYVFILARSWAKIVIRIVRFMVGFLRIIKRLMKGIIIALRRVHLYKKIDNSHRNRYSDKVMIFSSSLVINDYSINSHGLEIFMNRLESVDERYLFFVHLYPAQMSTLQNEMIPDGFICLDFWPSTPFSVWKKGIVYRELCSFSTIPSGYYKIKLGIYSSFDYARLILNGTHDNSLDMGWHYLNINQEGGQE